jgi:hypothetical protein
MRLRARSIRHGQRRTSRECRGGNDPLILIRLPDDLASMRPDCRPTTCAPGRNTHDTSRPFLPPDRGARLSVETPIAGSDVHPRIIGVSR